MVIAICHCTRRDSHGSLASVRMLLPEARAGKGAGGMFKVVATTMVKRWHDDVWNYIADLNTLGEWDPGVSEVTWRPPL